jgi:hypothetical protein
MLLALNRGKDGQEELSRVPMRKICPESAKMKGLTPLFSWKRRWYFINNVIYLVSIL